MKKPNTVLNCALCVLIATFFLTFTSSAQTGVKISSDPFGIAHPSSMLDVESTTQGFLTPRMTAAQRGAIGSPATGLLVYQTDGSAGYWYYNGTTWVQIGSGTTGGTGIANYVTKWTGTSTLGTSVLYDNGTNVGIGTTSPAQKLHINGGNIRLAETAGHTAFDILSYSNAQSLWFISPTTASKIVLGTEHNWDKQISLAYTPGTVGAAAGDLAIGQMDKNAGTWTHGITRFFTNGAERMRINSGGSVGIGTTGPGELLHVNGGIRAEGGRYNSGNDHLELMAGVRADDDSYEWIGFYSGNTRQGIFLYDGPWTGANNVNNEFSLTAEGSNLLTLNSQNNHVAIMPKGGNLGIGTLSPAARVHMIGGGQILGTPSSGTSSNTRTLTLLQDGQAQVNFGSYPGNWTSALQIQSNDNARYLWLSPLSNSGNSRLVSMGSDFDIHPGNNRAATFTTGGSLDVPAEIYVGNWFRNRGAGEGLYNEATTSGIYSPSANLMTLYNSSSLQITSGSTASGNLRFDAANPYITASSYYIAPGGAYFNGGTVYTEAAIQARGGISNDASSFGGDVQVNEGLRIAGAIPCIQGQCPPNQAVRLTPNLHLNAGAGYAVIANWDNGTTGTSQAFRIGNGAGSDVFQVWADGSTGIGSGGTPSTSYQLNVQKTQTTATGDGQATIYGFRTRDSQNDGGGYGIGSTNSAIQGYNYWGDVYTFGTVGYSYNDYTRTGGILGSQVFASYWGSLGYKASNSAGYGLYYTSAGSGGGFLPDNIATGIGAGGYGGVIGSWTRGDVMGHISAGELFASYNLGNEYTSGYQADIVNTGEERVAAYSVTSTDIKVYGDGEGALNGTSVFVPFEKEYAQMLGSTPRVTVSPLGSSAAIYIKSIEKNGFTVASDNAVNVQFTWIAVGKRIDAGRKPELPADLADNNFDENMKGVMFNENNLEQSATPVWYDGAKVRFDKAPEVKTEKKEPHNTAAAKAQADKVNELIKSAAKNTTATQAAADAPTLEKFPVKSTVQEPAPVVTKPEDAKPVVIEEGPHKE